MTLFRLLLVKTLILVLLLPGCFSASYEYASSPATVHLETEAFTAGVTPEKGDRPYYSGFRLDLKNLSDRVIAIDWNRTRYLLNGKNQGGFVWKGIDPASLKTNTVPEDEVAPGQVFSKRISPLAKVAMSGRSDYSAGKDKSGLYSGILPSGENSVLLAVVVDGQLVRKKLTVTITEKKGD